MRNNSDLTLFHLGGGEGTLRTLKLDKNADISKMIIVIQIKEFSNQDWLNDATCGRSIFLYLFSIFLYLSIP